MSAHFPLDCLFKNLGIAEERVSWSLAGREAGTGRPKLVLFGQKSLPCPGPVGIAPFPKGEEARPRLQMDRIKSKVLLTKQKNSL